MSRGLVIGESLIDIVQDGRQVTGEHVGGSPLNVAVGLARLGRDIDFLTHIADDPYGRRIAEYINAQARTCFGSQNADGPRRAAELRRKGSGQLSVRSGLAAFRYTMVARAFRAHRIDCRGARTRGVWRSRSRGHLSGVGHRTFDPTAASLIADREPAITRIEHLVERSDIVKVSEEDLRWIDPRPVAGTDRADLAVRWARRSWW